MCTGTRDIRTLINKSSIGICSLLICEIALAQADELTDLGQALFFDTNLSANRTQSCGTCHDPGRAFTDGRDSGVAGAVSLGDDGKSLGDRNTPSTTYAFLIPEFHKNDAGEFVGGYFLDGRAATMVDQAAEPFLNLLEMALPNRAAVVDRVRENPIYIDTLRKHFGESIFSDVEKAFRAITESIVAFERTAQFAPFDSKYDRYLRGEYELTVAEELGRVLFFSQLINCSSCHLLDTREFTPGEVFSNHRYHNIGLPTNRQVRERNGIDIRHRDLGLLQNPVVDDPAMAGRFRVPSLRNVAVTGPYMHNGIFRELRTAILFYNRFTLSNPQSQINPETGQPWGEPEVRETVDLELLREGQPMAGNHIDALVAFLAALTDQRYESLLDEQSPQNLR